MKLCIIDNGKIMKFLLYLSHTSTVDKPAIHYYTTDYYTSLAVANDV